MTRLRQLIQLTVLLLIVGAIVSYVVYLYNSISCWTTETLGQMNKGGMSI